MRSSDVDFEKPKLNIESNSPLSLNDIKFFVLTEDTAKQYFANNSAAFALTEEQYKNLAINVEEIKYYIRKQLKVIQLYKEYYEGKKDAKEIEKR
ncbi:MAG: hypothetical protein ACK5GV_08800 [Bacteroidota bacterium]